MKRLNVIALILCLSHITQGFVLLTANIEDIKKLARKFVSESLTEKIADFIAKATEQMVANVSEENDRNENRYQDISKENNAMYKVVRQGIEKEPQRYHKNEVPRKPKRVFKAKKAIEKPKRPVRVNLKNTPQKDVKNVTKKEPEKSYKYPKQYSYSVNPKIKKPLSTEIPHLDSTIGIAEKFQPEKEMSKIDEPKNLNRFRLTANSKETLPNDFESLQKVLTTRKEKNEFDQYDNTKYLKAEYVATSGPVVLPKIPSEDWWGKEKKFKRNKEWE